jgi:hypothetical protein
MKKYTKNIIIVHTARTWERIRVEQPFQEMDLDNIESAEAILEIAKTIFEDEVIQKFIKCKNYDKWHWEKETKDFWFSDSYIEHLAEEIIKEKYL